MAQTEFGDAQRIVMRAWRDDDFKRSLLRDPRGALRELGIDVPDQLSLAVYDNTGATHHMVICTPCSCYPSFIGVAPPYWKDPEYKAAIRRDPAGWLERMGVALGPDETLQVVDTDVHRRAFVIPKLPEGETVEEAVVTATSLVGHTR